ncbi:MAG: hypothetical protein M1819_002875 [Sarea resinae]|nr:MAG: hypothetical protein M1819_002875 [Sarea resinae]
MLIYEAKSEHDAWFKQASKSMGLGQAMGEYRKRYNRAPPPNFDEWYKYATTRGSLIIDDFDSINDDLLPFWSLSPKEIRLRTWEMISNPWNEISGISIRNGEVQLSPNVLPTHRWMLDGVASMIRNFAQFLPDMDLAFNLNDESRVAVPYEEMEKMRKAGRIAALTAATTTSNWSESRAEGWKPIPSSSLTTTRFVDSSFHNTFDTYGSIGCPPNSAARTARSWNTRDVCISCLYPHTLGQFVQNWTLASSPCHQPDLARLHGFYLSPAAFKTTHDLMPVFSQSRPHPYADILYPSAWNYIDKVIYDPTELHPDPPFPEKGPDLFWRGATSEGVSPGTGTWKGMTRQRLAHLSSNLTDAQSVLLPTSSTNQGHPSQYRYVSLSPSDLASILPPLNASIVSSIARCGGPDCSAQKAEFPFAQPIDFQAHWRHKYLFDVDGAGFSGRFLPFLQSRSLPFKSALFREWYHHRLAAWMHFVPVDLRLGGVWSLLAYFEGVDGAAAAGAGKRIGKDISRVKWAGHEKEAMRIAEAGRYWSQKVVRKEDMEVYFFRLLLEWGRLTDDQREGLAFGA